MRKASIKASKLKIEGRGRKSTQLSSRQIAEISNRLYEKFKSEERERKYAPVKEVLSLLGKGILLTTLFMAPNSGKAMRSLLEEEIDYDAWKQYNPSYLKRAVNSLEKQKQVKIILKNNKPVVKLTEKGKVRILKFAIDELEFEKPNYWDGKWRLVVYDVPSLYKGEQEYFRAVLKRIGFLQFQKSVYLFPYDCRDEIEYFRSFLGIREFVRFMIVDEIENDQAFKTYFALK